MKVYALIVSKGSWDDYFAWTIGIFDDPFKANEAKRKLIAEIKEHLNKYSTEQIEKFEKKLFDSLGEDIEITTELKDYFDFTSEGWTKYNIDTFCVEEFELNTIKQLK